MANDLRPLKIGEILDRGFKVFFRNLAPLVIVSAITVVPIAIISLLIRLAVLPDTAFVGDDGQIVILSEDDETRANIGTAVSGLLGFVGALVTAASLHHVIADAYVEHTPDWRSSLRAAIRRLGPVLIATLAIFVIIGAPIVLAVLSGAAFLVLLLISLVIYLGIATSFAIPALMRERIGGFRAVSRSFELVSGRWWRSFAVLLVAGIILMLFILVVGGILGAAIGGSTSSVSTLLALRAVVETGISVVLFPLFVAFITVLYFDHRVRREGYDLEQLARESGIGDTPSDPPLARVDADVPASPSNPT